MHQHHDSSGTLSFEEKMIKLLQHWLKHNEDHAATYRQWAERADQESMPATGRLLMEAADASRTVNDLFQKALKQIEKGGPL